MASLMYAKASCCCHFSHVAVGVRFLLVGGQSACNPAHVIFPYRRCCSVLCWNIAHFQQPAAAPALLPVPWHPQVRLIAAMLSPLLEAVVNQPSLADPTRGAAAAAGTAGHTSAPGSASPSPVPGSGHSPRPSSSSSGATAAAAAAAGAAHAGRPLGPVAAAAAALLQLRLLEVFFFLPAAQLWGSCHEQLLQLCCRQLLGVGGSRVSPGEGGGGFCLPCNWVTQSACCIVCCIECCFGTDAACFCYWMCGLPCLASFALSNKGLAELHCV